MHYEKIVCPNCLGDMIAQIGRRGFYFFCLQCRKTLNKRPKLKRKKFNLGYKRINQLVNN